MSDANENRPEWERSLKMFSGSFKKQFQALPPPVGVPRRFGIGTILMFMVLFSIFLTVMKNLRVPGEVVTFLVSFFACVAVGQILIGKGEKPRLASVIMGTIFFPVAGLIVMLITSQRRDFFLVCISSGVVFSLVGYAFVLWLISRRAARGGTLLLQNNSNAWGIIVIGLFAAMMCLCPIAFLLFQQREIIVVVLMMIGLFASALFGAFAGYVTGTMAAGIFLVMNAWLGKLDQRRRRLAGNNSVPS